MKTTLELPDDLMRAVKMRAIEEKRTLKDMVQRLLRQALVQASRKPAAMGKRVALPLVECAHAPTPSREMTPARVAEVLLEQETGRDPLR